MYLLTFLQYMSKMKRKKNKKPINYTVSRKIKAFKALEYRTMMNGWMDRYKKRKKLLNGKTVGKD